MKENDDRYVAVVKNHTQKQKLRKVLKIPYLDA